MMNKTELFNTAGTDRYADIIENLQQHAQKDDDIRAVIAIGSSTRRETPADEYSDLDLIIVTKQPDTWFTGEYPKRLGKISISFLEPTLGGGMERRSIYDAARDVDMIILTPDQFEQALKDGVAGWVMNRGYSMLYDPDGYAVLAAQYVSPPVSRSQMTNEEFINLVNDFFFHNIWACKKLLRGELWSAKMCIDAYLKNLLLKVIEQYCLAMDDVDVWHDGRFLDRWADTSILENLKGCFAHYTKEDCMKALIRTHQMFARIAAALAERKEYCFPDEAQRCAAEFLESRTLIAAEDEQEKSEITCNDQKMLELILKRRSYRGKYKNVKVPREHLTAIMEAGIAAPSGCNKQTASLIAVDDETLLTRIKSVIDPPVAGTAPAMICVLTQRVIAYRDRCFATQDYAAAIENMLLTITSMGYQSCWYEGHITDADRIGDRIAKILGVPDDYELVCILPVGVAEEEPAAPKKKLFEERAWFNGFARSTDSKETR